MWQRTANAARDSSFYSGIISLLSLGACFGTAVMAGPAYLALSSACCVVSSGVDCYYSAKSAFHASKAKYYENEGAKI